MRYTTIIDLREQPLLYRSTAVRLLYLHLVLISGYHDDDRDMVNCSIRQLARDTGLTISAVRCALQRLQDAQLLTRQGDAWMVKKWILEKPITARAKTEKAAKARDIRLQEEEEREQRHEAWARQDQERKELAAQGKTSYMIYYESMLDKAQNGDVQALQFCRLHKAVYESHKKAVQNAKKQ